MAAPRINKNKGFTIAEFVVYMAILAVVLASVILFAVNLVRNERALSNRIRILNEADFAMRHIVDAAFESVRVRQEGGSAGSLFNTNYNPCVNECELFFDLSDDGTENIRFFVNNLGRLSVERSGASGTETHELNSPRVSVLEFIVDCVGDADDAVCAGDPKGARVKFSIRDVANVSQTQTITTSLVSGGF